MAGTCVEDEYGRAGSGERSCDGEAGGGVPQREPRGDFGDEPGEELEVPGVGLRQAAQGMKQRLRQEDAAVLGDEGVPRRDAGLACQHYPSAERDRGKIRRSGPDRCGP